MIFEFNRIVQFYSTRRCRCCHLQHLSFVGDNPNKGEATNVIFNNKTLINFGIGVTEHEISCHLSREERFGIANTDSLCAML